MRLTNYLIRFVIAIPINAKTAWFRGEFFFNSLKMTWSNSFYLIIIFCFLSCSQSSELELADTQDLKGEPIKSIEVFSRGNVRLCVADTFLIIQKNEEPILQIYSTNSHELLAEYGRNGIGPGEFQGPSLLKQISLDADNQSPVISVYDYRHRRVSQINLLNTISGLHSDKSERLPGNQSLPYFFHKDKDIMVASPQEGGKFLIHDFTSSETTIIPYVPALDLSVPATDLSIVYKSTAFVNKDRGLIVGAPLFLGELNFFNLNGELQKSIELSDLKEFSSELAQGAGAFNTIKYSIAELDATDDLIYGLNYNNSVSSLNRNRKENIKVQVFNWDGELQIEYILDDRLVKSFAIDEAHNRIYAYSPDQEEYSIILYEIN